MILSKARSPSPKPQTPKATTAPKAPAPAAPPAPPAPPTPSVPEKKKAEAPPPPSRESQALLHQSVPNQNRPAAPAAQPTGRSSIFSMQMADRVASSNKGGNAKPLAGPQREQAQKLGIDPDHPRPADMKVRTKTSWQHTGEPIPDRLAPQVQQFQNTMQPHTDRPLDTTYSTGHKNTVNGGEFNQLTIGNVRIHDPGAKGDGVDFMDGTLKNLNQMSGSPSGQKLLGSIVSDRERFGVPGKDHVDINYQTNAASKNGRGAGSANKLDVNMTPGYATDSGKEKFGDASGYPTDLRVGHELIHTDDGRRGYGSQVQKLMPLGRAQHANPAAGYGSAVPAIEELRAVGLGPFQKADVTERKMRAERVTPDGAPDPKPDRPYYGTPTMNDHRSPKDLVDQARKGGPWGSMPQSTQDRTRQYIYASNHGLDRIDTPPASELTKPPRMWNAAKSDWVPERKDGQPPPKPSANLADFQRPAQVAWVPRAPDDTKTPKGEG